MHTAPSQNFDRKRCKRFEALLKHIDWDTNSSAIQDKLRDIHKQTITYGTDASYASQAREMTDLLQVYWGVAANRYIDNVCQTVRNNLLFRVPLSLKSASSAMLGDHALIDQVMQEAEGIARERALQQQKVERLAGAKLVISRV
jgi:Dynamin GTPase effector domain